MRKLDNHEVIDAIRLSEYAFQYKIPEKELDKKIAAYSEHEIWGDYEGGSLLLSFI